MKNLIILVSFLTIGLNLRGQDTIDSLSIIKSISNDGNANYHVKNKNHYSKDKKDYILETDGEVHLPSDGKQILKNIIYKNLSKEKLETIKGKRIIFSLLIDSKGQIQSVNISVLKEDINEINFTKQECKLLMEYIKKDIIFNIEKKFTLKNGLISVAVPVTI